MTAPERIYLQDAGDYDAVAQFEVTWCEEPQDDADTEYIRADLATPAAMTPEVIYALSWAKAALAERGVDAPPVDRALDALRAGGAE